MSGRNLLFVPILTLTVLVSLSSAPPSQENQPKAAATYILGAGDQLSIRVVEAEEIPDKPFRIDETGSLNLPVIGVLHAAGLTAPQLQAAIVEKFRVYIRQPQVTVFVTEMHSQPVSVIGAVNAPGIHQLQGHKTLIEMLSLAGGTRPDAGYRVRITRRMEWGEVPVPGAIVNPGGESSVGEVPLKGLLDGTNAAGNIAIMPDDVITLPAADLIYVIGDVKKSGGFVLGDRRNISVLQALAMAEGLSPMAKSNEARILRASPGTDTRAEIPIDLKKILAGKSSDIPMQSNDVLFVPTNGAKRLRDRTLDAMFSIGSGIAIYRP